MDSQELGFPPFRPLPFLGTGHLQTTAAFCFATPQLSGTKQHFVPLDDGDQIVLHDDCPDGWHEADRSVVIVHGLGGCHGSAYMCRAARRLTQAGYRTFRMDMRGCGAGQRLAAGVFHAARSADLAAALRFIQQQIAPESPVTAVGYSLGANLALRMLGECGGDLPGNIDSAIAVSPPIRLGVCSRNLWRWDNRIYDWYFVMMLLRDLRTRQRLLKNVDKIHMPRTPRSLNELDKYVTVPLGGFDSIDHYYETASSGDLLTNIQIPSLILAAADDPIIPVRLFHEANASPKVQLHIAAGGGHLGFLGRQSRDSDDRDGRWMDWRIVEWIKRLDQQQFRAPAQQTAVSSRL